MPGARPGDCALLAADTGSADVVIGTYVTNRNRAEFRKMFGMFSNLVTLRFRCEPKLSFRAWLSVVRKASIEIEPQCYIPVQELRSELRSHGVKLPAIPVIFHQASPYPAVRFADLTLTTLDPPRELMPWQLTMHVDGRYEERNCIVTFDARMHEPSGVREFLDRFKQLLGDVSRNPDLPLERLLVDSPGRQRWMSQPGLTRIASSWAKKAFRDLRAS